MKKISSIILIFLLVFSGLTFAYNDKTTTVTNKEAEVSEISVKFDKDGKVSFEGYTELEVDGGDLSGDRKPNVVVDIGFGDREYYAFTNEHGQLEKVYAKKIILQDDSTEKVLSTGRYFRDEAKVPGVESPTLDEGHVIADSLGGVSNAYNITPQESTLNRHGDQAYMERGIREANGCTDFIAIITYADTKTQIPNHYSFTYTLKENIIKDEFDNVNPDEVNKKLVDVKETISDTISNTTSSKIAITSVDLKKELVLIKNNSTTSIQLKGYKLVSVVGNQSYTFPEYKLDAGKTVIVYSGKGTGDLKWTGRYIWNNDGDPAELYNKSGTLISTTK